MENYIYATILFTDDYVYGCIGLMYSGKQTHSKYPFYCLVTPNVSQSTRALLRFLGYELIEEDMVMPEGYFELYNSDNPNLYKGYDNGHYAGVKFLLGKGTQFKKIIYLDADIGVLKNLDELFKYNDLSAVTEGWSFYSAPYKGSFHAAMFVIEPNLDTYESLMNYAAEHSVHDNAISTEMYILDKYSNYAESPGRMIPTFYMMETISVTKDNMNLVMKNGGHLYSIHCSFKKPWKHPLSFFDQFGGQDLEGAAVLSKVYAYFLNECIKDLRSYGGKIAFIE